MATENVFSLFSFWVVALERVLWTKWLRNWGPLWYSVHVKEEMVVEKGETTLISYGKISLKQYIKHIWCWCWKLSVCVEGFWECEARTEEHSLKINASIYNMIIRLNTYAKSLWIWMTSAYMAVLADSEKRIQAFETKSLRKPLRISYLEHKTNVWVRSKINSFVGPQEPLLATIKRQRLAWFRHVIRHDSLSKTILQGTMEGRWHWGW